MEENLFYVLVGALGAVLAMLLLLLVGQLWHLTVLPLWHRWRYRGVNIAGGWKGLGNAHALVPGEWTEVGLTLEQDLRELRGLLWVRQCSPGGAHEFRLPVAGRISGGYVALSPPPDCDADAPFAAALLKVEGRGASLNGQLLFREAGSDGVEGILVSVHRAASMALPRLRPLPRGAPAAA